MKKNTNQWFMVMTVLTFMSIISFFQIQGAWSSDHNFNGLFGWLGIGIVTGLGAIGALIMTSKSVDK